MSGFVWQRRLESRLAATQGVGGAAVMMINLQNSAPAGNYTIKENVLPSGIASTIQNLPPLLHRDPFLPPYNTATTMFILNGSAVFTQPQNGVGIPIGTGSVLVPSTITNPPNAQLNQPIIFPDLAPQYNGIAAYVQGSNPLNAPTNQPAWLYVLLSVANGGETIWRYQINSNPPYRPAGLSGDPTDPTFVAASSMISGVGPVLTTNGLCQGLTCSADGTLAASDGPVIWILDAETGQFKGAGVITLEGGLSAYTLAFGPDGNLYVLAAPPAPTPQESYPPGVSILRFLGTTAIPSGINSNDPTLITSAQLNNGGGTAMTVGGSATNPVIYVFINDQDIPGIMTFNASTGASIQNALPPIPQGGELIALGIVNFYTDQMEIIPGPILI